MPFIYIFFSLSLSKLLVHIHSLFIFTTSFCLFPSSFYTTVTPTSCYHLWFVLLSSQACVSCYGSRFIVSFLSKFSFIFFSLLPSSPRFHSQGMKNFQYSHFSLVGMELYSKHWSTSCRRSEKKRTSLGHRSPASLIGIGTLTKMACRCNLVKKKKKNTLINTTPTPLFSNSHFSFHILLF